mmetsp:Transcript_99667/g.192513  ORF Transcript_99667/g.192513 Transcript_99667/m.192513 type:complete len:253 (-) Transcript_99667:516-1274(-)
MASAISSDSLARLHLSSWSNFSDSSMARAIGSTSSPLMSFSTFSIDLSMARRIISASSSSERAPSESWQTPITCSKRSFSESPAAQASSPRASSSESSISSSICKGAARKLADDEEYDCNTKAPAEDAADCASDDLCSPAARPDDLELAKKLNRLLGLLFAARSLFNFSTNSLSAAMAALRARTDDVGITGPPWAKKVTSNVDAILRGLGVPVSEGNISCSFSAPRCSASFRRQFCSRKPGPSKRPCKPNEY